MNRVDLMGRLTRDPEIRYGGQNNMAVAKFTLAVNRKFKNDEADFINCVSFGKTAETIEKFVSKGTKIAVCGRIQTGSYTNKDGNKVYTTDVVVEEFEFCESKSNNQNSSNTLYPIPPSATKADMDGFMNLPDDIDEPLPFT